MKTVYGLNDLSPWLRDRAGCARSPGLPLQTGVANSSVGPEGSGYQYHYPPNEYVVVVTIF